MNTISLKDSLLILLHSAHEEEHAFLARLNTETYTTLDTSEPWSRNEILKHLTSVKQRQANRLISIAQGEIPLMGGQYTDQIFESYQNMTWTEMQLEAAKVFETLIEQVRACNEEDLANPLRYTWLDGQSLAEQILIKDVWHTYGHFTEICTQQGNIDYILDLYEKLVHTAKQANMHPLPYGGVTYNLACMYVRTGQRDKAIEHLSQALKLYPAFLKSAQEDPDFDDLRAEPAVRALLCL